ncbi:MAG: response regulator [Opitutaceae bacterium]|nr:response regulator [Opitutaceae bacterium]
MPIPVLLVAEDSDIDALLLARLIERSGYIFKMMRVEHGEAAIDYLAGNGDYADREKYPVADLLLLDLKMPLKDGFAVLQWRQDHPGFRRMPAIVFSSSYLPEDVERAYALGASSYVVKPGDPERLERFVRALHAWWTEFNVADTGLHHDGPDQA